ncbi:hypothetical protein BGX23_001701 [Mortierella sp. AD031]|nr:hypothetical protein BGX23_001701 [Mortierella sp. AD031]KAG0209490.1 hypothetical protein BGX33_005490 [Mortierella sp. NVP41]
MKFILAPLMAIATFAGNVAAAAEIDYAKYGVSGPIGDVYAYWPNKKDSDPDVREVELTLPTTGKTLPYRVHYKDPKDNKYDLSIAEDADDAMAAWEEAGTAEDQMEPENMDLCVNFSVFLDDDEKVVHLAQGMSVPTSYKDELSHMNALVRSLQRKLDPNTPGIEDLQDPGSIAAQYMLNPTNAKNNPVMVSLLDGLYDTADEYFKNKAELEAKVAEEEKQAQAGKKEKRHNKPHHHHKKFSQQKKKN